MRPDLLVPPVVTALLVSLVALRTEALFESGQRPLAAVVVPLAVVAVAVAIPGRLWALRVLGEAAVVVGAVALAVHQAGGDVAADLPDAFLRGLATNLAAPWPVAIGPTTVGGVVAMIGVVAAASAELAVARRPGPVVLAPVAALVGLLALLTAPAGAPSMGAMLVVGFGTLAVLRSSEVVRRRVRRRAVGAGDQRWRPAPAVASTAAVALVGVLVTSAVASGLARWDPREQVSLPSEEVNNLSPLSLAEGWRRLEPAEVMFRSDSTGSRPWRLVALSRYDGRSWMPAADYRPTGRQVRPAPEGVPLLRSSVVLERLSQPWLPAPLGVVEVSRPVAVDEDLGGLLLDTTPPEGFGYEVTVTATEPASTARDAARSGPVLLDLAVSPQLVDRAVAFTAGATNDYERALLLAARLRREYELDPDAPAGHSLLVLDSFLDRQRPGREEQFVAAYALLAAAIDLPVRLVVGFEPEPSPDGGLVALSSGVRVWPEVNFVGAGWLPFDPVPAEAKPPEELGQESAAAPSAAQTPQAVEQTPPTTIPSPVEEGDASGSIVGLLIPSPAVAGMGLALLAVAAYLGGIVWYKRRRREQRRRATPDRRVTGAFSSGVDTLVDLGARARASATHRELVAAGAPVARGSLPPLGQLAEEASAAVFSPRQPGEDAAERAWAQLEEFERAAAAEVGRLRWLRARLSLRSLRRLG